LRSVKGVFGGIERRKGLSLVDKLLGLGVSGLGSEQSQRGQANVRLQRFPGLMAYRACSTSCTRLFDFSGLKAMISLIAATMIQNWAEDKNSKDTVIGAGVPLV
jgi:hypothetical protein